MAGNGSFAASGFKFLEVALDKCRPFQQILWQITAEAKLGKYSQIRSPLFGFRRQGQDARGITREIADGGIELREG